MADDHANGHADDEVVIVTPWRWDRVQGAVRACASKTYQWTGAAWDKCSDYDRHHDVGLFPVPVSGLDELAQVVEIAAANGAYIVRGTLTPHALDQLEREGAGAFLNRRKVAARPGDKPSLREADRRWVMLDIDGWPVPAVLSLHDQDDHEQIIDALIRDVLHPAFHEARCFFQFSASCGLPNAGVAKCHLWFWLARPASNDRLRRMVMAEMPGVDHATFSAVQPHYVAPPKLIGGHDPLPVRIGWRDGIDDEVTLPEPAPASRATAMRGGVAPGFGWTSPLLIMGDGPNRLGFYAAIRDAVWRYCALVRRGGTRDDDEVIALVREAIRRAPKAETRTNIDTYSNENWLRRLIEAALCKQAFQQGIS